MAQTMNQLIFFRAIQGLGSGIGLGLGAAVVGDLFPPEERASKQGLFGIVFGVANLLGPTLGGVITDHGPLLSGIITASTRWRWLFYLNLPFGLFALLALWIALPSSRRPHRFGWAALQRVDFLGALVIAAATCCLLVGLTVGSAQLSAWTQPRTIGLLVASVVLYILFVVVERKAAEPLLPLDLFRHRVFAADAGLSLVQGMTLLALSLPLLLFLQGVLALSPTAAGAVLTVLAVCVPIGAALSTIIVTRRKRYQSTVIIGMVIMTIGIIVNSALSGSLPTTTAARLTLAEALQPGFLVVLGLSVFTLVIAFWLSDVSMTQ